ncbi:prealbumin-like fold domain-containing protein [Salinibacterium sp. ZJ77]|uniref:prealbumin-like fold domain-containing protein n=1 Tax=Salinibacterium sp. ZJ77 TaxID=2708337 RepID=UPI00141F0DAB|nr:prealbumin-like fold domain-containing protein [Salinibacterium sp. ZJ77]
MSRRALSRSTPLRRTAAAGLALALVLGVLPLHSATSAVAAEPRATAFVETPNTFYTLQRSLPPNAAPTVSIERRTATDSGIANNAVTLGGMRTLPGVNGHSANALGVSSDGVFYFTTQRDAQTRAGGVSIWRYEVRGMPGTTRPAGTCFDGQPPSGSSNNGWACAPQRVVSDLSLNSGVNGGGTIVGGAVHPISGAFYFTYISGTPEVASALNPTGPGNVRAHVYRYDPQRAITEGEADAGEVMHVDMRKHATFITDTPQSGGNLNGDIAFDGQGNLLITVSNPIAGAARGQMMLATVPYDDYREFPTIRWTENAATVPTVEPRSMIGGLGQEARFNPIRTATSGLNGLAYTSSGQLIAQQGNVQAVASPTTFISRGASRTITSTGGQAPVDLASSRVPATITVLKNFEERIDDADQVRLSAALTVGSTVTALDTVTTSGTESGPQGAQIGPVPFEGKGAITLGEELVPSANAALYSSVYACYAMPPPYNTRGIDAPVRFLSGEGTSISLSYVQQMAQVAGITVGAQYDDIGYAETDGFAITCEFTNGALRPALSVAKSAVPESGTPLEAGETVHYRLTFDNSTGLAPATVDHVDHLADVLDDASFVDGSVRYGDGTESGYPARDQPVAQGVRAEAPDAAQQLAITGVVPAGAVRTVWFSVAVRANEDRRPDGAGTTAYQLLNVISPAGELPPTECVEGATSCTVHPVPAWTVTKTSNPLPGAWVHDGGNIYYALQVQKVAPVEFALAGITVVDDMSEVMSVARMDEAAPDYGGSYRFDVRTFDASGAVVRSFLKDPTNAWDDRPFDVSQLYPVHSGSSDPRDPSWRWTLELPPLTLAENEVRAEIMYVVRVGGAADPAQPSQHQYDGDAVLYPAPRLARFVNSVSADAAALAPNQCRTGEDIAAACQVAHTVADHYFHIQKNSTSRDAAGDVIWNLAGAEWVIRDYAPAAGWPSGLPAAQLCRTNYAATYDEATGTWTLGDQVGTYDADALPDWSEGSATYDSLIAYNDYAQMNGLPQVPLCALFYALVDASYGQAPGTWHARNLDEGAYELIETRAPDGHQLLAQPVAFVVGAAAQGHQLDLIDRSAPAAFLERCTDPARLPSNGSEACVMSVGWLLQVYDTQLQKLPLSGGWFTGQFTLLGSLIVLAGLIVAIVRLMRRGERPHNPLAPRRSAR